MANNEAAVLAERLRTAAETVGAYLVEGHVRLTPPTHAPVSPGTRPASTP